MSFTCGLDFILMYIYCMAYVCMYVTFNCIYFSIISIDYHCQSDLNRSSGNVAVTERIKYIQMYFFLPYFIYRKEN